MTNIIRNMLPNNIVKYSKKGCRLLSKVHNGNTKTAIIETDFGKSQVEIITNYENNATFKNLTITHRNASGKVIKKLIKSYTAKFRYTEIQTSIFGENKNLISCCTEKQNINSEKDGSISLLRIKFKKHHSKGNRYEEQAYEYLHNAAKHDLNKTLYTTATRLDNGQVINKTINGNLQNLDEIAQDPYLYIRNYSKKEFVQSASYIAAKTQRVGRGKFTDKILKEERRGYYNQFLKKVVIDSSKLSNEDVVKVLNHEFRHKYQITQISKLWKRFLNIFKSDSKKILMTPSEIKEAKKFLKEFFKYGNPDTQYEKYYNNFLEVDARNSGVNAQGEYNDFTRKLIKTFAAKNFVICME